MDNTSHDTLFDAVGGEPWFVDLIDRFYDAVDDDPILRPLYPEDLTDSKEHMVKFLVQYWGGPGTYSEERGHPRLRMRHAPFSIGLDERNAWLGHMLDSVRQGGLGEDSERRVTEYFEMAATHLINRV